MDRKMEGQESASPHARCVVPGCAGNGPRPLTIPAARRGEAVVPLCWAVGSLDSLGLVLHDRDGRVLLATEGAARILGLPLSELLSRGSGEPPWPASAEDGTPLRSGDFPALAAMDAGTPIEGVIQRLPGPAGSGDRWVQAGSIPLVAPGEGVRAITALNDVTALKRAEEALRRRTEDLERSNADLAEFATIVSHDLKEPLRTIGAYAKRVARSSAEGSEAKEYLEIVVEGVERMRALLDDLLRYARVQAPQRPARAADAGACLDMALAALELAIEETRATVTRGGLPTVLADSSQLTQLFQNLLDNAVKFRGPSPPRVHVDAARQGEAWRFSFRDEGIGFDPRFARRIFAPFQRLNTREEYPGTGMGLAISRKIVERHGGRIWADSEPGRGTTVSFTLPAA